MSKIAYLFPGQGAQKVGMGRSFYETYPEARALFEQANAQLGFDLASLCFEGPEDRLRETEVAQVALFTTSIAAWTVLQAVCPQQPAAVAGHSVGEYAALVASGTMSFEDGLTLVKLRGELMRDAARRTPGTMAAILGIEAEAALQVCEEARAEGAGGVYVANYNGGGQVVISGEVNAVARAGEIAKTRGAKRVLPLSVSGAFHSPQMVMAGDALFPALLKVNFRKPHTPILLNVSASYAGKMDDLLGALTMQVSRSVQWEASMQKLLAEGCDTFIELGSGDVLTGLMKRIDRSVRALSVQDAASLQAVCHLLGNVSEERNDV